MTFLVSICVIWVFPLHFIPVKNTKSSLLFWKNGVLILNWKENKEAGAIFFEIRIPRKKNKELFKIPIKNLWKLFCYGKKQKHFWLVNNSENHHREMGLVSFCVLPCSRGYLVRVYLDIIYMTLIGTRSINSQDPFLRNELHLMMEILQSGLWTPQVLA